LESRVSFQRARSQRARYLDVRHRIILSLAQKAKLMGKVDPWARMTFNQPRGAQPPLLFHHKAVDVSMADAKTSGRSLFASTAGIVFDEWILNHTFYYLARCQLEFNLPVQV
jgi:hypothetical protein